jgi:hypothetical protein
MSAGTLVPLEEYLAHTYEPDCEYVDGEIVERNAGEYFHSLFQGSLTWYLGMLLRRDGYAYRVLTKLACAAEATNDGGTATRAVMSGRWSEQHTFLAAASDGLPDSAVRDRVQALLPLQISASETARRFGASGHVVDSVPLALYFAQSIAFAPPSEVLARTIGAGGIPIRLPRSPGQLAGAVVGAAGIPHERLRDIDGIGEVAGIAERFAELGS